jgi:hypothetical protein
MSGMYPLTRKKNFIFILASALGFSQFHKSWHESKMFVFFFIQQLFQQNLLSNIFPRYALKALV